MGESTTIPPSGTTSDPVSSLFLSDTFYTWFNTTNDLINKVNPIEVYTIRGITQDGIAVDYQKGGTGGFEGITIDDLGNGNFRIGYILPEKITGGHTFFQHVDFKSGPSGHIVNSFNGSTGEIIGVNTVNGLAPHVAGGSGNMTGCAMFINGITVSATGHITLTAGDISGSLASSTGPLGFIITATGGFEMDHQVKLFDGVPDAVQGDANASQNAILIHGASGGSSGLQPRVGINTNAVSSYQALKIEGGNWYGSAGTAGGILLNTDGDWDYDIRSSGIMNLGSSAGFNFVLDLENDDSNARFAIKNAASVGQTAEGAPDIVRVRPTGLMHVDSLCRLNSNTLLSQGMIQFTDDTRVAIRSDTTLALGKFLTDFGGATFAKDEISGTGIIGSGYALKSDTAGRPDWQVDYVIADAEAPTDASSYDEGALWLQTGGGAAAGEAVNVGSLKFFGAVHNNNEFGSYVAGISRTGQSTYPEDLDLNTILPPKKWWDFGTPDQANVANDTQVCPKGFAGWDVIEIGLDSTTAALAVARPTRPSSAAIYGQSDLLPIGEISGSLVEVDVNFIFREIIAAKGAGPVHGNPNTSNSAWNCHLFASVNTFPGVYDAGYFDAPGTSEGNVANYADSQSDFSYSEYDPVKYEFCEADAFGSGRANRTDRADRHYRYQLKNNVMQWHSSRTKFAGYAQNVSATNFNSQVNLAHIVPAGSYRLFLCVADDTTNNCLFPQPNDVASGGMYSYHDEGYYSVQSLKLKSYTLF